MSNGVGKLLSTPGVAREVDLLAEFYDSWVKLHKRRSEGAEREELEQLAQELLEGHVAVETYRNRLNRKPNG